MPPTPSERPLRYHTFLLSLWAEAEAGPDWRCSLEDPRTGERRGFKTIDELAAFLKEWAQKPPEAGAGE